MHVAQPADEPVGQLPGALVARPAAARPARAPPAGRPRRSSRPGRRPGRSPRPAASSSTSAAVACAAGWSAIAQLLDLALELLLARADGLDELLRRLRVHREPLLPRAVDDPLRELPRLRRAVVAHLAARLLDRLRQLGRRLSARDQHEHGVGRHRGERRLERRRCRPPSSPRPARPAGSACPRRTSWSRAQPRRASAPSALPSNCSSPPGPSSRSARAADAAAPGVDLRVVVAGDQVGGLAGRPRRECT